MLIKRIWPKHDNETFFVTWSLHNLCNYRCTYCPPNLNNGTTDNVSVRDVENFYNAISPHTGTKKIVIAFSGGEPTLHPEFIDMIKFLSNQGCEICMTSNGSKKLEWWIQAEPYIDHLVISYHPQWAKKERLKNVLEFLTLTTWVNLDLMMIPEYWDETVEFGEYFKNRDNIAVTYLPIQQDFGRESKGLINYTNSQLEFLKNPPTYWGKFNPSKSKLIKCRGYFGKGLKYIETDQGTRPLDYKTVIANDANRFEGYECFLGQESLIIEVNGDIYNAYCHTGGIIGNIKSKFLNLKPQSVICEHKICSCSVDIEISKRFKDV